MTRDPVVYSELYHIMKRAVKNWHKSARYRMVHSASFYYHVGLAGNIVTPYMTLDASLQGSTTKDHCFAPRLVFRAMMDQCPELIANKESAYQLIDLCRHTVGVTTRENSIVKFKHNPDGLPIVTELTRDKYDQFTWVKNKHGVLKENVKGKLVDSPFPLKHMIPEWLTEFEMKCMKEQGYL